MPEPAPTWSCPSCSAAAGAPATYPPGPDAFCAACGRLLGAQERLAAAVAELVRHLAGAQPPAPNEPTAGVAEAARILKTTPAGVYQLRARGKMPKPIGAGRRLVWRTADLLECRAKRVSLAEKGERR